MNAMLTGKWWKILASVLLVYIVIAGFILPVPALRVLHETIRNLYFHVSLWFAMLIMLFVALVHSVRYLRKGRMMDDVAASSLARVAVLFGVLGFVTGMLWGNYTWGSLGSFLFSDIKILGAFIGLMIYMAYFVLRGSIEDEQTAARVSAVYSIFAYTLLIVFIFILPRMQGIDSLHPGNGGNPGFAVYDLDSAMRLVFYPAVLAYTLTGFWIASLVMRTSLLERSVQDLD